MNQISNTFCPNPAAWSKPPSGVAVQLGCIAPASLQDGSPQPVYNVVVAEHSEKINPKTTQIPKVLVVVDT
eukprot:3475556-Amphidinium_carterae.1